MLSRQRTYSFPEKGNLATTKAGLEAQFPNGLPPDVFHDNAKTPLTIIGTVPAKIISFVPETDSIRVYQDELLPLDPQYDPTNGIITVLKSFVRLNIRLHKLEIRIRNKDKVQGEERDDFSRAGDYFFVLVLSPCPDRKIFFSPSRLASGDDGCFYPSPYPESGLGLGQGLRI